MKTILIIEDDPVIARGLHDLLAGDNFNSTICPTGESGVEVALSENPDAILLDIGLPDMNGFDVLRQLRLRGYRRSVIMLTSRADRIDKITALEAGADDYITKPFDNREVVARLRANLRRSEQTIATPVASAGGLSAQGGDRKLLVIMFTDMKDFSKIMNEDEDAAIALLGHHNHVMDATIPTYAGRIIEVIGDAYLAAFGSSEHAIDCALNIQQEFLLYNNRNPNGGQISVRIGIHLGDVVEQGERLRGNAINVAARIQEVAVPGNVYVSEQVVSAAGKKKGFGFDSLGPHNLKNIKEPIHVYRVTAIESQAR